MSAPRTVMPDASAGAAGAGAEPARSSTVALVLAWAIVGIPAAWGLLQTVSKSLALFK